MSRQSFSALSLIWRGLSRHQGWQQQWRKPEPKPHYDAIIVGGGGHGLGAAYYLAQEHGLKAYMVAKWRRERARSQATALLPAAESFLPVQMARSPKQQPASIVERGAVRVRLKAHPISTCCGRPG